MENVEENGNSSMDPLTMSDNNPTSSQSNTTTNDNGGIQVSVAPSSVTLATMQPHSVAVAATPSPTPTVPANIVQFIPTQGMQAQSVIQANQSSVIQTATGNIHQVPVTLSKGGVLYVNKQNVNTVIQTAGGNTLQVHIKPEPNTHPHMFDTNSEESLTDDDSPKRRKEFTRRPSYHKILKEISGPDIAATTLQIANMNSGESGGLHTSSIAPPGSGTGTIIQLSQEPPFYIPATATVLAEDQSRKREIRLQKNREAARECRRKKKEYIKCLENRVAVLENQNKALIEELKALKELYCQQKND